MYGLSAIQVKQLLQPIHPDRVLKDPRGMSHVSQQDVTAHLTRVFGFCNWTTEILSLDLIYEVERPLTEAQKTEPWKSRWDVCYKATMRLTILDPDLRDGRNALCFFEDGSMGDAQNQSRGDAHDLAMKSAISLAKKRCAAHLGDQFGLSLYNKGQMSALVKGVLIYPDGYEAAPKADVQDGVDKQVSMGVDETEPPKAEPDEMQAEQLAHSLGAEIVSEETTDKKMTNTEIAIERSRKAQAAREQS